MIGHLPIGFALPQLNDALLALGVVAVLLLLRGPRRRTVPAPRAAQLALPREAVEVLAYLRARGEPRVQAPLDNRVLRAAVAAGVLVEEGRLFSPQGVVARFRVPEALWRAPLAGAAPAPASPPWLRMR